MGICRWFIDFQQDGGNPCQVCPSYTRKLTTMEFFDTFELDGGFALGTLFISLIGLAGNWRLFVKCGQPGWAVIVPGYNVVVAMRIIGRPAKHALLFLIPVYNLYFFFRTILELANTFGKVHTLDYVLACVFNVFYILNLGLSEEEDYKGPVYGKLPEREASRASMAVAA